MYAFTSSGSRKHLHTVTVGSLVGAVVLVSLSAGLPFSWLFQMAGILLAAAGIFLLTRYALRSYRYEITDSGLVDASGETVYDLTVTQVTGRRMTVVTRINLRDIGQVKVLDRAAFKAQRETLCGEGRLIRYENDPFSPQSCYLSVPDEHTVLAIPPDPGMVEILNGVTGG